MQNKGFVYTGKKPDSRRSELGFKGIVYTWFILFLARVKSKLSELPVTFIIINFPKVCWTKENLTKWGILQDSFELCDCGDVRLFNNCQVCTEICCLENLLLARENGADTGQICLIVFLFYFFLICIYDFIFSIRSLFCSVFIGL